MLREPPFKEIGVEMAETTTWSEPVVVSPLGGVIGEQRGFRGSDRLAKEVRIGYSGGATKKDLGPPKTQMRILVLVEAEGPLEMKEISARLHLTLGAVSRHVKQLKQKGYVKTERRGR